MRTERWRHPGARVTYPPLDVPKPVAADVWIVDSGPVVAMGLQLPVRMTIVRLAGKSLLVHSPTRLTPALATALRSLGEVRYLVAPGIAHWTFLREWQLAYPKAETWGAPGLRDRRQVRRAGVTIDRELADSAPAAWAEELEQGIVRGAAGFCEVYFHHRATRTLVLTDLIENLEPTKLPPVSAALMRLAAGSSATTALHVRTLLLFGGSRTAASLRAMIALAPERVIFAHGRWFADDGERRLRDAFRWLPRGESRT
jgi:hypothetical protein